MVSRLFWIAGTACLSAAIAQGDETFTWDSPHHLYRAVQKQDDVHQISDIQITSLTEPTTRPIFEEGGNAAAPILFPIVSGFWSDDDTTLTLVSGGKADSGELSVGCQIIQKDPQTSQFNLKSKDYQPSPDPVEQEAADQLFALHPKSKSNTEGGYLLLSCRWTGEKTLETENQVDLSVQDGEGHVAQQYRTKWSASLQVTDKGFVTTSLGQISYAELDAKRQPGAWQTLPETDQDRLRVAVRLRQADKVNALLQKGAEPNAYPNISLLTIAIGKDDPAMVEILLKAGAKVDVPSAVVEPPLDLAMMTFDGRVFDLIMATHPVPSHDASEDAYFDLYGGLGSHFGPVQVLDPKINPKAGPALAELARRLAVLKQSGFDINTADDKTGETILMTAVKDHATLPILQKLVASGANPTQRDKAGKSSADLAADAGEIDVLRFLDVDHSHGAMLRDHDIPADSPFVGDWSSGDDMALELKADGSGMYASMFACSVAWRQSGDMAMLDLVPMKGSFPTGVTLKGTAHITPDGKKLKVKLVKTGSPAWTQELSRTRD